MTTRLTLEQLEQAAAEAAAHAEKARAQAERERAAEEDRRRTRLIEFDRSRLADYDDAALEAEVLAAAEEYRRAVLNDPLTQSAVRLRAAQQIRYQRHAEATGDAARLGLEWREPSPPVSGDASYQPAIDAIHREASRLSLEDETRRSAQREAAGHG